MVKKLQGDESKTANPQEEVVHNGKTITQIIAENEAMAKTISEIGALETSDPIALKYLNEEQSIRKIAKVDADKITVKEIIDHKNISLWTKDGKRVGPLHRDNALAALRRFFALGILLTTKQPTPEEIAAYKETDEYKKKHTEFLKSREAKMKTRKRGEFEKILKQMSYQYGLTMDKLVGILDQKSIKSLSEGRAIAERQ